MPRSTVFEKLAKADVLKKDESTEMLAKAEVLKGHDFIRAARGSNTVGH